VGYLLQRKHFAKGGISRMLGRRDESTVSSLADGGSSGAGEELSFMQQLNQSEAGKDSALRHQLFLKATEAKRWQDSVLHLSSIATGKEEALSWERTRNTQLALFLEEAEENAEERKIELESAFQQVATLQCEMQTILGTCRGLESHVVRLENALQREHDSSKSIAHQLVLARQETTTAQERGAWRDEQSQQGVLEQAKLHTALKAKLRAAHTEVQAAQADREHALRCAVAICCCT